MNGINGEVNDDEEEGKTKSINPETGEILQEEKPEEEEQDVRKMSLMPTTVCT